MSFADPPPLLTAARQFRDRRRLRRRHESVTEHEGSTPAAAKTKSLLEPLPPRPLKRPRSSTTFGLIQEYIHHDLYSLIIQSILWNQTSGRNARPVLSALLALCPDPASLASISPADLTNLLRPIGLQNIRAARLISLAQAWLVAPPCKERRYRKLHYPRRGCGTDVKAGEILNEADDRAGWEIAHLPGVGPYALDSFRIFCRDRLRGINCYEGTKEVVEPEWKRVVPADKDLNAYLIWRWRREGWIWDPLIGTRVHVDASVATETSLVCDPRPGLYQLPSYANLLAGIMNRTSSRYIQCYICTTTLSVHIFRHNCHYLDGLAQCTDVRIFKGTYLRYMETIAVEVVSEQLGKTRAISYSSTRQAVPPLDGLMEFLA